jgi:RNA polymerase sigma-54 factor
VQRILEPPGIGARTLVECLELQLDRLGGDTSLEREIVAKHLEDVEKNRLPAIAKATEVSLDEVKDAIEVIRHLRPHPGADLVPRDAPRITPDVMVEYDENGELVARLTRGNSPRLRISGMYSKMLSERVGDRDTREFIRRNLEAAKALLDAIQFRRDRLLEVARIVIDRQREFFEIGPAGLKVLRMAELAERFNCDASTVSRTVSEKYMQTPRGIYPLRYFFTGGMETEAGESASWDAVKERVKEIIAAEDKQDPLSDDKVADMLKAEGKEVSRRTIAKYRQQLDIPSARQRKAY